MAAYLNRRDLPGIRFVPVTFTPEKPYPYGGQLCHGIDLLVTVRNQLNALNLAWKSPPRCGISMVQPTRLRR